MGLGVAAAQPPPPTSYLYTQMSVSTVDRSGRFVQTATCGEGDQMLGGGYLNPDSNHPASTGTPSWGFNISVQANYPSGPSSWTVVFDNFAASASDSQSPLHHGEIVQAYAYCFHAPNYSLDIAQVTADNAAQSGPGQTLSAACPEGSVLTGGGFAVDGPTTATDALYTTSNLTASTPVVGADGVARAWRVALAFLSPSLIRPARAYALCARKGLEALPAAVMSTDHTKNLAAIGEYEDQVECPSDGLTTGGGVTYIGDTVIAHPTFVSRSVGGFRRWHVDYFGGWQTPNYEFRPCHPETTDCFVSVAAAACFKPPAIPYISVVITSPASGANFDWDKSAGALTAPIAFKAQVFDRNGALLPKAQVFWEYSTSLGVVGRGRGSSVTARLPAGATMTLVTVRATATSDKLRGSASIQISTGTVQ